MNARSNPDFSSAVQTVAAIVLAAVITAAILWAVASLFQSRGAPMEHLAAAERACMQHAYPSERETCMKQRIAEARATRVASR